MVRRGNEKLGDKPAFPKSGVIPQIIMAVIAILLVALGVILEQYRPVAQFLAITFACIAIIYVLLWLPDRVSEYTTE